MVTFCGRPLVQFYFILILSPRVPDAPGSSSTNIEYSDGKRFFFLLCFPRFRSLVLARNICLQLYFALCDCLFGPTSCRKEKKEAFIRLEDFFSLQERLKFAFTVRCPEHLQYNSLSLSFCCAIFPNSHASTSKIFCLYAEKRKIKIKNKKVAKNRF